jgi:hypothetical protein
VTETQNFQMLQQYYRCNSALKRWTVKTRWLLPILTLK